MKVIVDGAKCQGHARCAAKAPEVFKLNDDGYNNTGETEVPSGLEEQAKLGASVCPEGAIQIEE